MIHYHHDRDMLGIDYEDTVFRSIIPVNDIGLHSWFIPLLAVRAPEMHPTLVQREGRHRLRNMLAAIQARLHCPTAAVPLWKHTNELQGELGGCAARFPRLAGHNNGALGARLHGRVRRLLSSQDEEQRPVLPDSRHHFPGPPGSPAHSPSHDRRRRGVLVCSVSASCAEDRRNSVSDLGDGESTGDLPSPSSPTDHLILQGNQEAYMLFSDTDNDEEEEEDTDDDEEEEEEDTDADAAWL